MPPVTRNLLIANVAVFLLQQVMGETLLAHFALWPWGPDQLAQTAQGAVVAVGFRPWQLVSYAFMHGGVTHLLFNMLALYMFGGAIERAFGARHYLIYYFVCLLVAALAQLAVVKWFTGGIYPTLGASGAIFGLLLAFGLLYPQEKVFLIFLPIPLPSRVFVALYAVAELIFGITGTQAGVAHFAHLGGMLGGYLLIEYWRGKLPIKPARRLMR